MSVIHEASFLFKSSFAQFIAAAIIPESDTDPSGRSTGLCTLENDDSLEIHITAVDLTALRAALNSWLRLVQVADEMVMIIKGENKR